MSVTYYWKTISSQLKARKNIWVGAKWKISIGNTNPSFSLLLARFRTYASSYASFANSPAGFYQIRTWMLWKLPGTRLFRVGWKKHLACLCFSTLNKKFEVKFERISLPQRGSEPGTPSLWVRCANHYTTDPFVIWRQKLVDYILQCCFWIKMG